MADQQATITGTTDDRDAHRRQTKVRTGRYMSRGEDRHPPIYTSQILLFPSTRPGRMIQRKTSDPQANVTFGDAIIYKATGSTRVMFQNVKGLTFNPTGDDYNYYMSSMGSYSIDIFGMAETNSGWQHPHVQAKFKQCLRRQLKIGKAVFGSPTQQIDQLADNETFQAGGSTQVIGGNVTTTVFGPPITDSTGLGRWCGFTIIGKKELKLSILTGYRTCSGSIASSPLGSTFHRKYTYFKEQQEQNPQPRRRFIRDLSNQVRDLQNQGHAILVMMDANSVLGNDPHLQEFLEHHDLRDLHNNNPAPSTYIGSAERRIDYMFGCPRTAAATCRQGTLSYFEGPQSDHRALYVDLLLSQLIGIEAMEPVMPAAPRRWLQSGKYGISRHLSGENESVLRQAQYETADRHSLQNTQYTFKKASPMSFVSVG